MKQPKPKATITKSTYNPKTGVTSKGATKTMKTTTISAADFYGKPKKKK